MSADKSEKTELTIKAEHEKIAALIHSQYNGLLQLMYCKLRNRDLANDLLNEAIVVTLDQARSGRLIGLEQVAGYVFKVSMNLLRNHLRNSDNRMDLRVDASALEHVAFAEKDSVEQSQLKLETQRLLASLKTQRDREVVKRFYLDEQDKQEICAELGLTILQFTQVISRARRRMKTIFDSHGFSQKDFLSLAF